jgi:flagellar basal-body rod protein FlgG
MADALSIAVQSMQNDTQRMDIISQNVVNSATPGYRRALASNAVFAEVLHNSALPVAQHSLGITLPAVTSVLDPSTGSIRATGQPLDLAIDGEGYFELTTPDGPAYTRAGNFHLDESGRLVSQDGFPVSGKAGDIVIDSRTAPTILASGDVNDGERTVGQIRLVKFADKHGLLTGPRGLLVPAKADAQTEESAAPLQAGYIENSNVVPLNEMVNMLETSRHFESQQKLFQGYDDALSTAIQRLGQF